MGWVDVCLSKCSHRNVSVIWCTHTHTHTHILYICYIYVTCYIYVIYIYMYEYVSILPTSFSRGRFPGNLF